MGDLTPDAAAEGAPAPHGPRRIGMLGGTFDPPHRAHLALAEAAYRELRLERVLFVVAGDPWRKHATRVSPAEVRLEMVRAAVASYPWAEVSTIEVDREGPTYTAETLEALVQPGEAWWFILGADALADMPAWREPERIVRCARLAVARRPGVDVDGPLVTSTLRAAVPGIEERIDVLSMPLQDVSSTEVRARVRAGAPTDDLLPLAVREVIDARGLYRD